MGAKRYARCTRWHPITIMINGKIIVGGQCACELAVRSDGTFIANAVENHKCDLVYTERIVAEYNAMPPATQQEFSTYGDTILIPDKDILLFSNAIKATILGEQKIGVNAEATGARRFLNAPDVKMQLLTLAGLMNIDVGRADRQALIVAAIESLVEGNSTSFFGGNMMGSSSEMVTKSTELFRLFNDWISNMQGTVDSHGEALCAQAREIQVPRDDVSEIQVLRDDMNEIKAAGDAAVKRLADTETKLADVQTKLADVQTKLADVMAHLALSTRGFNSTPALEMFDLNDSDDDEE